MKTIYNDTQKITIADKEGFRKGTARAKLLGKLRSGMTVLQAAEAVGRRFVSRAAWRGVIKVTGGRQAPVVRRVAAKSVKRAARKTAKAVKGKSAKAQKAA